MFSQTIKAASSATRILFGRWSTLIAVAALYGTLLLAGYLFVSTREATIAQLVVTLAVVVITPLAFFTLQAVSVNYTTGSPVLKKTAFDALRLVAVSIPVILLTVLAFKALGKTHSHLTVVNTVRYLLAGVVAPLLTIQLWIAASRDGLRELLRRLHHVAVRAFAPQSVLVYACGVLFFAVAPYLLIFRTTQTNRAWLEVSLLTVRLIASALLILIGWVTTIGTLSLLTKSQAR
jgi:hypothetical protein